MRSLYWLWPLDQIFLFFAILLIQIWVRSTILLSWLENFSVLGNRAQSGLPQLILLYFRRFFIIFHVLFNIKNLVKRFFIFLIRNLDRDFFKEIENREILDFGISEEILCDLQALSGPSIKSSYFLLFCSSIYG